MHREHYVDDPHRVLLGCRRGLHILLIPVLVLLVAVLYLELIATHVGHSLHAILKLAERAILLYFAAEVGLDLLLFEDTRTFLRKKWFDILLILPFLNVFRAAGRAGRVLRGFSALRGLRLAQLPIIADALRATRLAEIPILARIVAIDTGRGLRLLRELEELIKVLPKIQKVLHFIRGLPSALHYLPKANVLVGLATKAKLGLKKAGNVLVPISLLGLVNNRMNTLDGD